ncbi:alpha/beta hydrolase family protein [Pseudoalteromonas luteoviolacea]|uniref:alpha/beta hydrolase family protein n=1 Tax=Pseudoalteromonas luteoviolacea TaxID=43657 RepID=UPI000B09FA20|nr:S9 family peptidase [Pseudoalteromonas luteoviolacea]
MLSKILCAVFLLSLSFGLLAGSHQTKPASAPIPISHFSKGEEYANVQLSPSGKYISFISKVDGKNMLGVLLAENFSMLSAIRFESNAQVGDYHWVNAERIVVEKEYLKGWTDQPHYYGELYSVNADGSSGKYLVGYQGGGQTGSRISKATALYGTSYVLDPLVHDERHMLIYTVPWTASKEPLARVYRVNVKSGKRKRVTRAPGRNAQFLTDHLGNLRFAATWNGKMMGEIYQKNQKGSGWQPLEIPGALQNITLYALDQKGESVYLTGSKQGEPDALYKFSLKQKELTLVYQDKDVSPTRIWVDPVNKALFAIELDPGYPTYAFTDEKVPLSNSIKSLLKSIPGHQLHIVSSTLEGTKHVVFANNDRNPGDYYLFDQKNKKMSYLFSARAWIDPELMAETKPVSFQSRDGHKVHGYLTLPTNREAKNLPLVVMPHGGPHGVRDYWQYETQSQLFASRGMAVLRVNFRGSGGYGRKFTELGYLEWGRNIQYDILDGVDHVVAAGYVDPDNMCIFGESFGGYSALQSTVVAPNKFKCAIGVVGVYDLTQLFKKGDVASSDTGQSYLKMVLGDNEKQLREYSPALNAEKVTAPVLIIHGGDDVRAPVAQAEAMVNALKKANKPVSYYVFETEGHGFYKEKHRLDYFNQLITFLEKHLHLEHD